MIPEAVVTMLACARIGAPHSVVFGGFSAEALRTRINDAEAKLVVTADGGYRRGAASALKPAVDEALAQGARPSVQNVLVVKRTGQDVDWDEGRDVWWPTSSDAATRRAHAGRASRPSTRCSSSTPPAPPGSRRASCTPPAAT